MRLEAENLGFRYGSSKGSPWIFRGLDFTLESGQRTALVGPSGCGKSTLSRVLSGYLEPSEGRVLLDGKPLPLKGYCPVQMIYQHPEQAVNPRWKMEKVLKECWDPDEELLKAMGIEEAWLERWPSELSGGELQRAFLAQVMAQGYGVHQVIVKPQGLGNGSSQLGYLQRMGQPGPVMIALRA